MKKIIIAISLLLIIAIPITLYISNSEVTVRKTSIDFKENVSLCYEIFPIAYRDGDGDGIGDIKGITDSIEYLNELQVDCIWITPIHPSKSYHKYDVIDYYEIDSAFGTLDDYKALIEKAHENDIRVVMDFVINHTSNSNEWFKGWKEKNPKYIDYYVWATKEEYEQLEDTSGWHKYDDRYYFGSFWDQMPELNYENPKVRQEIYDIAKYWLDLGVDGFRIDAAKHIYDPREHPDLDSKQENIDFFIEFNDAVKKVNKDAFIVGEIWTPTSQSKPYLEGMDSVFNFDFGEILVDAINKMDSRELNRKLTSIYDEFYEVREDAIISNFLTNHDQNRILNQLVKNKDKMIQAAANYLMQPGISWIYYGEELGMTGIKPDERIREPFLWVDSGLPNSEWIDVKSNNSTSLEAQRTNEDSYFNYYKKLTVLRQENEVIKKGSIEIIDLGKRIFAFERKLQEKSVVVISNFQHLENTVEFDTSEYEILFSYNDYVIEGNKIKLSGNSTIIIGSKH